MSSSKKTSKRKPRAASSGESSRSGESAQNGTVSKKSEGTTASNSSDSSEVEVNAGTPLQIVVLGMHRSGTSALTGALARMGIHVGDEDELTGKSWENPQGFFERRDARNICDALLHGCGADWWKVSAFEPDNVDFDTLRVQRPAIRNLVAGLDQRATSAWALKEPRLCLLMPIFRAVLTNPFAIVVVRHPMEVARSLRRRNGFPIQAGLALWEAYTVAALENASGVEHTVVSYDELVEKPQQTLKRLCQELAGRGLEWVDSRAGQKGIQPSLRRERIGDSGLARLTPEQRKLWGLLEQGNLPKKPPKLSRRAFEVLREFEADQAGRERITAENRTLERALRKANATVEEQSRTLTQRKSELESARFELSAREAELSEARTESEKRTTRLESSEARKEELANDLSQAQSRLEEQSRALAEQTRELESARSELSAREAELAEARTEAGKLATRLESAETHKEELSNNLSQAQSRLEKESRTLAEQTLQLESARAELSAREAELVKSQARLESAESSLNKAKNEIVALRDTREKERKRAGEYEKECRDKANRIADLQNRVDRQSRQLVEKNNAAQRGRIGEFAWSLFHPLKAVGKRRMTRRAARIRHTFLFDECWYLKQNPDVLEAGENAALHYIAAGGHEDRPPHPLFDPDWYTANCQEDIPANITPLEHYLLTAPAQRISPHRLFDRDWYLEHSPDVAEAGIDPLEHFIAFGGREGRNPHPEFDSAWYLDSNPDVAESDVNPLIHYLKHGTEEGRSPSSQADSARISAARSVAPKSASATGSNRAPTPSSNRDGQHKHDVGTSRHGCPAAEKLQPDCARKADSGNKYVRKSAPPNPGPKLRMTALVISWDIGHNPFGRAYMLAEAVDRIVHNVILAGFQFPRYGNEVWEPLRDSRIPVIRIPGKTFPEFLEAAEHIAATVKPDVVFACKPRLPSLQLGLRVKELAGCPLILDNDDHELSFFKDQTPFDLDALEALEPGSLADQTEPYEEIWTRLAESLIGETDAQLVSNTELQNKFGGVLAPHVRDENRFLPESESRRSEARKHFGIPVDAQVVLFFGTPRLHKGVDKIAEAVGRIDDPDFRFVIVGAAPDRSVLAELDRLANGRVIQLPNQNFDTIPEILSTADVVALPQDVDHPISRYQLPAKAIDAIAAGKPLLVSRTPPMMDLVRDGVASVFDPDRLPEELERAAAGVQVGSGTRETFEQKYSYAALACTLRSIITNVTSNAQRTSKPAKSAPGERLVAAQRRIFNLAPSGVENGAETGKDFVVFWKQNDTTLYGRRHDMVIKYLASRPDVRKVVVFDAPISMHQLRQYRSSESDLTHDRHIYVRTQEKALGLRDQGKVQYRSFIFPPAKYDIGASRYDEHPELRGAFIEYIQNTLATSGVDPKNAIFWLYPKGEFLRGIIDHFKPAKTVVDIVDDHRAWPDVSDIEKSYLQTQYRQILQNSDQVICNCDPVRQSMTKYVSEIEVIPNGCDAEPPIKESSEVPAFEKMRAWRGQVIGFIGNLEPKIDIELLDRISREFPNDLLVLLGSTHANVEIRTLLEHENVLMPGVIPYDELGGWLDYFSIGLIPHRRIAMTEYMNPLKAYVYLAHGVPVVATNVPNTLDESPFFNVSNSHEEFITALREKLRSNARGAGIDDFVRENSWERRFENMVDALIGALRVRTYQSTRQQRSEPCN